MPIVGGLDIHRRQVTFDYPGTVTGQVCRGQVSPAGREHLRAWLARFAGQGDVAFAVEGCAGWRYVAQELAAPGIAADLAEPAGTAFARGRKRHAKTGKADCRHLRMLLAEGRLPQCWIPPAPIPECRALPELYTGLRRERTARAQRIHAVLFHQGAPVPGERWAVYEAGKTHARACAPDHRHYAAVRTATTASAAACPRPARSSAKPITSWPSPATTRSPPPDTRHGDQQATAAPGPPQRNSPMGTTAASSRQAAVSRRPARATRTA